MKYKDAGVDIDAGEEFVRRIKARVRTTFGPDVLTDLGSFGGVIRLPSGGTRESILVASIDGVGTRRFTISHVTMASGGTEPLNPPTVATRSGSGLGLGSSGVM